jgi:hypothetical protein
MKETFAGALRAEIEAVVTRYEALVAAQREAFEALSGAREADALRAENAALRAERDSLLQRLAEAEARVRALEDQVRAGEAATTALAEQFTQEKRFAEAFAGVSGTMLADALQGALGQKIEPTAAALGALKAKGMEAVLIAAFKERGRSVAQAPLLEREKAQLAALAAAAACDLLAPEAGVRFSAATMDKAATVSDPAEEGNVVECLLPGLRRAGTDGALVFPRVRVATG